MNRRKFLSLAPLPLVAALPVNSVAATGKDRAGDYQDGHWQERICGEVVDFHKIQEFELNATKYIVRWRKGRFQPTYALGALVTAESIAQDPQAADKRIRALRFAMQNTINIVRGKRHLTVQVDGRSLAAPEKPEGAMTALL